MLRRADEIEIRLVGLQSQIATTLEAIMNTTEGTVKRVAIEESRALIGNIMSLREDLHMFFGNVPRSDFPIHDPTLRLRILDNLSVL